MTPRTGRHRPGVNLLRVLLGERPLGAASSAARAAEPAAAPLQALHVLQHAHPVKQGAHCRLEA